MDDYSDFIITDNGSYYTIENIKANDFNNYHTHIKKKHKVKNKKKHKMNTCELLIHLVCKKIVPNSPYLRCSAKRISRDEKYISKIEWKECKDSDRIYYFKPNKGVRR